MAPPAWPSRTRKVLLLGLVLALAAPPATVVVNAQQPLIISGVSLDFNALTAPPAATTAAPAPTPTIARSTPKPSKTKATTPAPAATTKTPAATTKTPVVTTAAPAATNAGSGSYSGDVAAGVSGNSTQPAVAPSPASTPAPVTTTAAPVATKSHDCNDATSRLITKLYENNDVLEGDCAAVNNYYRFPFDTVPSRAQLINMSKSASCTVLMQALLQLVPSECDFKRIPVRSTAEAILQLAKDLKSKGESAVLPSEAAITKAIEARRQDLLSTSGGSGSKATDGGAVTDSSSPQSTGSKTAGLTTASSASGSGWTISNTASVSDDGQHILMDTDLLVVGTWSDNPESSSGDASPAASTSSTKSTGSHSKGLMDTQAASAKSASSSLQFATVSVQAALVAVWIFLQ
ncbi:hypothetical protein Gpo141_00009817 [Globisporangium polare]